MIKFKKTVHFRVWSHQRSKSGPGNGLGCLVLDTGVSGSNDQNKQAQVDSLIVTDFIKLIKRYDHLCFSPNTPLLLHFKVLFLLSIVILLSLVISALVSVYAIILKVLLNYVSDYSQLRSIPCPNIHFSSGRDWRHHDQGTSHCFSLRHPSL